MSEQQIIDLIRRRRLQLLVHSAIYYSYNESLVTDEQWKQWAMELEKLQVDFPELAKQVEYHEAFEEFDHSTGYDLPFGDPNIMNTARWLLKIHPNIER